MCSNIPNSSSSLILLWNQRFWVRSPVESPICGPSPNPPTCATRYFFKKSKRENCFSSFEKFVPVRNSFVWSFHLLFIFIFKWEKIKNKSPSMAPIRKKWSVKTTFWVQESGYLSGRYLMRGSTPLGLELGLYWWTGYMGAYGSKIKQTLC